MKAGVSKVTMQKQHPNTQRPQRDVPGSELVLTQVSKEARLLHAPLQHYTGIPAVLDRWNSRFSFREFRVTEGIGP